MKELIDTIWNMPAADFLALLLKVALTLIVIGGVIVLYRWWVFKRIAAKMEKRSEEFRRKHGFPW